MSLSESAPGTASAGDTPGVAPVSPYEALARAALAGVAPDESVGELSDVSAVDDSVVDLAFAASLPGYVGWHWTVSVAHIADTDPSVLEVELLPGDGSLLAPPWVPWADRLAEYRRTHPDEAPADDAEGSDDDLDDDDLDDDAIDEDDDDEDAADELDLDGVDLDGVDLDSADLDSADLEGADLDGAVVEGGADSHASDFADIDDGDDPNAADMITDEGERTP